MWSEEINLIEHLLKIGFSINDAYEFLTVHGFIKPWCIYEETGLSVVNDYALEHIVVV